MKYVVDASVCVKWYIPEQFEQEATTLLTGGHMLNAPELILPEVCNIIWKKVQRAEITQAEGERIVTSFSKHSLALRSHKRFISAAYTGATATGQTVYDWTYLALAVSLSCEFVTADKRFYNAIENTPLKKNLLWIGDI